MNGDATDGLGTAEAKSLPLTESIRDAGINILEKIVGSDKVTGEKYQQFQDMLAALPEGTTNDLLKLGKLPLLGSLAGEAVYNQMINFTLKVAGPVLAVVSIFQPKAEVAKPFIEAAAVVKPKSDEARVVLEKIKGKMIKGLLESKPVQATVGKIDSFTQQVMEGFHIHKAARQVGSAV